MCFRKAVTLLFMALVGLAAGQSITLNWEHQAATWPSRYAEAAFAKDGRVVLARNRSTHGTTQEAVVCLDKEGNSLWVYPVAGAITSLLATTDDRVYVTVAGSNPYTLCLTQDGGFVWRVDFSQGAAARTLAEMRLFGDNLLVVGTGRVVANGTGPRPVVFSISRQTGALNYVREYLVYGTPYGDRPLLRSNGTNAFILARKSPSIASAILMIVPSSGELVATLCSRWL